ncbi:hypothetical protein HK103_003242 [Boothiomyces macroporosus]|uniref:Uncharacterized protein n=1 Tax=Boothiomyces macroporosus TaxID=261099 RepID=A0AAD5UL68_9FUNG|nr:hypothetical protein HK103_003242 [Boothiomyces macroporosus]
MSTSLYVITLDNTVDIVSVIVYIFGNALILYVLYRIVADVKQKNMSNRLYLMQAINFIQFLGYGLYGFALHPRIYFKVAALFSSMLSVCIGLLNIEILAIFKCLNEKITPKLILFMRTFFIVISILLLGPAFIVVGLDPIPPTLDWLNDFTSLLHAVLMIIYDNIQAMYLTHLVYSFKMSKKQETAANSYKRAVILNLTCVLIDWTGAALYLYAIYFDYSPHSSFLIIDSILSFHASFMVLIFLQLQKLALSGVGVKKSKPKPVTVVENTVAPGEAPTIPSLG